MKDLCNGTPFPFTIGMQDSSPGSLELVLTSELPGLLELRIENIELFILIRNYINVLPYPFEFKFHHDHTIQRDLRGVIYKF